MILIAEKNVINEMQETYRYNPNILKGIIIDNGTIDAVKQLINDSKIKLPSAAQLLPCVEVAEKINLQPR